MIWPSSLSLECSKDMYTLISILKFYLPNYTTIKNYHVTQICFSFLDFCLSIFLNNLPPLHPTEEHTQTHRKYPKYTRRH